MILLTHICITQPYPSELIDDVEEDGEDIVTTNVVIEECNDIEEATDQQDVKSSDNIHLLSIEKTRRHKSSPGLAFNELCDGGSIYTTPSMLSLITMPSKSEDNAKISMVSVSFIL